MSELTVQTLELFAGFSILGWITLMIGISWRMEKRKRDHREDSRTTGRIADYIKSVSKSKGREYVYWMPVIEFTVYGEPYRFEYENHMKPEQHPVGESVTVLYDEYDPADFHLEQDETYARGAEKMIRYSLIWIAASAVVAVVLAAVIFGDFPGGLLRDIRRLFVKAE